MENQTLLSACLALTAAAVALQAGILVALYLAVRKSSARMEARLQVIRADEFLNRTMDRVEEATEAVHKTVVSPVRQVSGLFRGLSVGVEALLGGRRRRRHERSVQQDEMFI